MGKGYPYDQNVGRDGDQVTGSGLSDGRISRTYHHLTMRQMQIESQPGVVLMSKNNIKLILFDVNGREVFGGLVYDLIDFLVNRNEEIIKAIVNIEDWTGRDDVWQLSIVSEDDGNDEYLCTFELEDGHKLLWQLLRTQYTEGFLYDSYKVADRK